MEWGRLGVMGDTLCSPRPYIGALHMELVGIGLRGGVVGEYLRLLRRIGVYLGFDLRRPNFSLDRTFLVGTIACSFFLLTTAIVLPRRFRL